MIYSGKDYRKCSPKKVTAILHYDERVSVLAEERKAFSA